MWSAALSHCLERFEGRGERYRQVRSGGAGAFTADNFPVFDYMRAERLRRRRLQPRLQDDRGRPRDRRACCSGEHSSLLHPFRYERFATGDLHPVSHCPYPWS